MFGPYRRRTQEDGIAADADPALLIAEADAHLESGDVDRALVAAEAALARSGGAPPEVLARARLAVATALGQAARTPGDAADALALVDLADGAGTLDPTRTAIARVNAAIVASVWSSGTDAVSAPADASRRVGAAFSAVLGAGSPELTDRMRPVCARLADDLGDRAMTDWVRSVGSGDEPVPAGGDHASAPDVAAVDEDADAFQRRLASLGFLDEDGEEGGKGDDDDGWGEVRSCFRDGDRDEALRTMRRLAYDGGIPPADLVVELGRAFGNDRLADAGARRLAAPGDHAIGFQLAWVMVDVGLHDLAVPLLEDLNRREPGHEEWVVELAAALDHCERHAEAAAVLRENRELIANNWSALYLLTFTAMMAGDVRGAKDAFEALPPPTDPQLAPMYARVAMMTRRADLAMRAGPLNDRDLRGWHFVITGGLLLGISAFGDDDMNGRFAWISDSYENVRAGLDRLLVVLEAWNVKPPAVFFPQADRASEAVALAAGRLLGVDARPWAADAGAGLVVTYDLDPSMTEAFRTKLPGQILYTHASSWTSPPAVAPDVVTLLHQAVTPPWGERMRMIEKPGGRPEVVNDPPDDSPAPVLAEKIIAAGTTQTSLIDEPAGAIAAFASSIREAAAALQPGGMRDRFWTGGPVRSARFM